MGPGQNLDYVLVAFSVVWLGFFGYAVLLTRQVAHMRREIDDLRADTERHRPVER